MSAIAIIASEHRDVDVLSPSAVVALAQRREHADRREERRADVAERAGGLTDGGVPSRRYS